MTSQKKSGLILPDSRSLQFTPRGAVSYRYSFGTNKQIGSGDEVLQTASTENRIILSVEGEIKNVLDDRDYSDSEIKLHGTDYDVQVLEEGKTDLGNIGHVSLFENKGLAHIGVPQPELRTIVTMFASGHPPFLTIECDKDPEGEEGVEWVVTSISLFRRLDWRQSSS